MWINFLPSIFILSFVGWYISRHVGKLVLQMYILIASCYLNLFPSIHYLYVNGEGMYRFAYLQLIIFLFFQVPIMCFAHFNFYLAPSALTHVMMSRKARLSSYLPVILILLLLVFWFVAIEYELFFRRIGHEGLMRISGEVPLLLLYLYRCVVETAFFIIIFLCAILRVALPNSRYYQLYKIALATYLVTFLIFFAANSRMQFVLLLICLICTQPTLNLFVSKRFIKFSLMLVPIVFGLTLFRELYLEVNERLEIENLYILLLGAADLIATR
jgi:hypothetical protein